MISSLCRCRTSAKRPCPISELSHWKTPRPASKSRSIQQAARPARALSILLANSMPRSCLRCGENTSMRSHCARARIICRRCAPSLKNVSVVSRFDDEQMLASFMSILPISIFLAEDFHEIAQPVDYSLIPTWAVFVGAFPALSIIGLIVWLIARRKKPVLIKSARERTLELLDRMADEIEMLSPYKLSIR